MKIVFNGSFSNGKSTLKHWASNKYNLVPVPEVFRTILAERELSLKLARSNLSLLEEISKETIIRQHKEEVRLYNLSLEEKKNGIATCRGLDSFSFLIRFCSQAFVEAAYTSSWLNDYITWLKKDSIHFLIAPKKELLEDDGLRDTDWNLSLYITGIVESLLKTNGIKYALIDSVTMSDRTDLIERVVNGSLP